MRFDIEASLTYDFPAPCEVLLLVEASHGHGQTVLAEALTFWPPVTATRIDDAVTGERRTVFMATGRVNALYRATVEVAPSEHDFLNAPELAIHHLPGDTLAYLRTSRYSPSDRLMRFVEREFGALSGGTKVAAIVAWIASHIDYQANVSHSATTAVDTFIDRAGVCRDFSNLMVALCRAANVPARAVSAYAWGLDPPDLHAVAEVYLGGRWWLIDATGMARTESLVRVATGRDAADIAFMTIFGSAALCEQHFKIARTDG